MVFFSSFRQFKPIAVPRPVVLRQVQTLRVHTNDWAVACSVYACVIYTSGEIAIALQPVAQAPDPSSMHAPLHCWLVRDCLNFFGQNFEVACSTAVKVFYSTVATAQLAVHTETESSGFGSNSIRQRAATFSLPDSVSKRAIVDKRSSLREESVKRYV